MDTLLSKPLKKPSDRFNAIATLVDMAEEKTGSVGVLMDRHRNRILSAVLSRPAGSSRDATYVVVAACDYYYRTSPLETERIAQRYLPNLEIIAARKDYLREYGQTAVQTFMRLLTKLQHNRFKNVGALMRKTMR